MGYSRAVTFGDSVPNYIVTQHIGSSNEASALPFIFAESRLSIGSIAA